MKRMTHRTGLVVVAMLAMISMPVFAGNKPLKIYILAGQSNMQGHADEKTLAGIAMDPETKPLYELLVDKDGKPRVHDNVYMAAVNGENGKLTAGYGASKSRLGPELAFGATLGRDLQEPILIIKTAWGGKSLRTDFRPPSAEPLQYTDYEYKKWIKTEEGLAARSGEHNKKKSIYYDLMMEHVNTVLKDPGKYCPAYDPKQGYEIAGFVWFQGFNDLIAATPNFDWYESLLCHLIRDVRKDLKAPKMPFVIGVIGISGRYPYMENFQKSMAAPAELPEFKGNVIAAPTAVYMDKKLVEFENREYLIKKPNKDKAGKYNDLREKLAQLNGGDKKAFWAKRHNLVYPGEDGEYLAKNQSNRAYHYFGSAKIYSRIGEAFAKAMMELNRAQE